jgi:hypothetical protein
MFASNTSQVANDAVFVEDVMSTFLYTGNGSTQTITNGIDLAGKGGLVWIKNRTGAQGHNLYDTARGRDYLLRSNSTAAQAGPSGSTNDLTSFNANGFSLGTEQYSNTNDSAFTYASWTFRKQPKFFDVVTYTGAGDGTTVSHNLGSTPGCVIVKATSGVDGWFVYHKDTNATPTNRYLKLNTTDSVTFLSNWISVSDTTITFPTAYGPTASSGTSYVAYLFAHDAGGFGLTGTDNVISCGSFTTDGSGNATVSLGYEPQWIMAKASSGTISDWFMYDNMRGLDVSNGVYLRANSTASETAVSPMKINATGFSVANSTFDASSTYIYIAIRRGPMKVPTSGASVFSPNTANASTGTPVVTNFPVDLSISVAINGDTRYFSDRLRGVNSPGYTANQPWIASNSTGAELTNASIPRGWDNTQILLPPYYAGGPVVWWNMRRAPSFFDEVCYTATGSSQTINHNLTTTPELIISKRRSGAQNWFVLNPTVGYDSCLFLNLTDAKLNFGTTIWSATSTTLTLNGSALLYPDNYVSYLFATCAGVSKVGSYTGTGTTLQVNCGFTGGARFVLIKRTDSTGDWYVWDTARGIVSGNDPYLLLNSTAAETTGTDYIDTYSAGFEISSTAPAAINASGGTFIFLAIA